MDDLDIATMDLTGIDPEDISRIEYLTCIIETGHAALGAIKQGRHDEYAGFANELATGAQHLLKLTTGDTVS